MTIRINNPEQLDAFINGIEKGGTMEAGKQAVVSMYSYPLNSNQAGLIRRAIKSAINNLELCKKNGSVVYTDDLVKALSVLEEAEVFTQPSSSVSNQRFLDECFAECAKFNAD